MPTVIDNNLPTFLKEPRPFNGWQSLPDIFGDVFYYARARKDVVISEMSKYGVDKRFVKRGDPFVLEMDKYLPRILTKTTTPFVGDLIPSSSWGSSLANLMSDKQWAYLRDLVITANSGYCQFCGSGHSIEAHEYWQYHEPVNKDHFGVQKLVNIMPLCKKCHFTQHLGFASQINKLDETLFRLSYINRLTKAEMSSYVKFISERYERRSKVNWLLDLTCISSLKVLEVNGSWVISSEDKNILEGKKGQYTAICGIDWQLSKNRSEVIAGITKEEAYS